MFLSLGQLVTFVVLTGAVFLSVRGDSIELVPYFTQEPSDIIVQKNRPVVLNCAVKGNPKPAVKWNHNGVELNLTVDDRRSILPSGSLYFKRIVHTKNNRPDEGHYQCIASSQIRSQSYEVVSRTARLQVAGLSSKVVTEPSTMRVRYGDIARIVCKVRHSIPKAQVTWKHKHKDGTVVALVPNKQYTFLDNGVLQINNVKWSDAGEYMCTANNTIAARTHSSGYMTLNVEADQGLLKRPSFIAIPLDTNTTKGGRVILECAATGIPKPTVQWYRDSTLISYDSRVRLYGESNLEITNITTSDEGAYTCKIFADDNIKTAKAKLLVHYPPTFQTKPTSVNAHVNDDIVFSCLASGNPAPTITWLKNGNPLKAADYIIITKTTIKVMYIMSSDTGMYQCVVRNYLHEIQAAAELTVFEKDIPLPDRKKPAQPSITTATTTLLPTTMQPTTAQTTTTKPTTTKPTTTNPTTTKPTTTIPTTATTNPIRVTVYPGPPENVAAQTNSETEIELTWDPPKRTVGKILAYSIIYNDKIDSPQSIIGYQAATGDLRKKVIKNLKQDTQYSFQIFARNRHGTGELSQPAYGWTASKYRPGMPLSLAAVGASSSQIKVQWAEPTTGSPVKEYILEYKEASVANATMYSTVSKRKHKTLKKLKTYTQYEIWVYSGGKADKRSHPATTKATTYGGVPKGKPRDVTVRADGTGTVLLVTWEPPSYDVINGKVTKYLLEFSKPDQKVTAAVEVQGDVLKHKLKNLDQNSIYKVRVAAGSLSGIGDFSQWVRANTSVTKCSESHPPGPPTEMEVSIPSKGSEMIKVEWQPPIDASQWCVTGYALEYGEGTPFFTKQKVNASSRSYLIRKGISGGKEYVIKLVAINSQDNNGPNIQKVIKVPLNIHALTKPVKQIHATPLTSRSVRVTWVEYIGRTPNLYHVFRALTKTVVYCGNTTKQSIDCGGLEPYTYYTFIVRRMREKNGATTTNRTMEDKPSPPLDITGRLAEDNSSDLYLNWQIPEKVNGKILRYRIYYSTNRSVPLESWKKQDSKGNTMNARIKNVMKGKKYYFKMKVQNGAGWSDLSKTKMIPTYDTTGDKPSDKDDKKGNVDAQAGSGGGLKDKTLWIVIAAVAGVTLIAIIVISVVLCKKRSGDDSSPRKPPPSYKAAVMANGSVKKKHKDDKRQDLWINHSENVEMTPLYKANPDVTNIPRSSTEMKPLDDHPIDKIKLDHERCSFRKGSQDFENDLPPPPPQLLDQDDDDVDVPSPIAVPGYSPYRPVVSYPRNAVPDDGTTQLSYPDYPLTSTPRHINAMPRSESLDNTREPNHTTPLLRSHSDDFDHAPSQQPPIPIYAVPKPKTSRLYNEEPRYKVPPPTQPKPGVADDINLPPVGYSIPNGVGSDTYPRQRTRDDTRDVVAELDSQLAGLEGLVNDLNEITRSSEYLT